jgi:ATP-dependent protease ClpP protease subunit
MTTPRLDLAGVVGDDIRTADVKAFLAANAGVPVDVYLNSPGGFVDAGTAIFNALREHGDVSVIVDGMAASAASLIAMGAKPGGITMLPGTLMMIHRAAAMTIGNANTHRQSAGVLDKIDEQVVGIYADRSGMTPQRVTALLDKESWFGPEEAVAAGLADHAEPARFETNEAPARASLNFKVDIRTLYRNPPQALFALLATETPAMTTPNNPAPAKPDVTADILERAAAANLSLAQTRDIVLKAAGNIDTARDLILEAVIASKPGRTDPYVPGHVTLDNPATLHTAVRDVLYARMSGKPVAKDSPAAALMGRSLLDLGAMVVEANGGKIASWHKDRLAEQVFAPTMRGAHSTSDFPALTLDSGNRLLLDAYAVAQSPLKTIARRRSAQDFRAIATIRLGEAPKLLEIPEGGEVQFGSRTETKEAFKLRTFGRIFALTRESILSDDLQAFSDTARAWGVAAANVEADVLYALIDGDGVVMEDNVALWNAAHSNVAESGTALDVDGLSAARKSLRDTKGLDGATPLNIAPKYLVVGSANETQGEKVLASIAAATVDDANVFSGRLTLLVEPRITDYAWFVFGDPIQAEVLSYANLGEATGPQLATRDGFTTLGTEFRAINDFGAGATGFRGAFKNAGAAPT